MTPLVLKGHGGRWFLELRTWLPIGDRAATEQAGSWVGKWPDLLSCCQRTWGDPWSAEGSIEEAGKGWADREDPQQLSSLFTNEEEEAQRRENGTKRKDDRKTACCYSSLRGDPYSEKGQQREESSREKDRGQDSE